MRDLLVAGGGPAGLATALFAADAGLDVAVLEPRAGPIDKACGEGLMPGGLAALADLGIRPDTVPGMPLAGISYLDAGRRAVARFSDGVGRGVRRTVLHAALRERVDAHGIPVVDREAQEVRLATDRVLVDGEPARYLVAADGLHSATRRRLGLDAPSRGPRRYGLRVHLPLAPWTDLVEVHWSAQAEAYVTPVAPDLVGVAVLRTGRGGPLAGLEEFPALRERVAGVTLPHPAGAGPLRQRSRRRTRGRVLLVGDASGYVDALTGEGISLGLAQARAAVAAVLAGDPESYERSWRRISWRYQLLTGALVAAATRPRLRSRIVPAAVALPGVFGAAVDQLARVR